MTTVFLNGFSNDEFFKMLSNILNIFFSCFHHKPVDGFYAKSKKTGNQNIRLCSRACIVINIAIWIPEQMPFIVQLTKPF